MGGDSPRLHYMSWPSGTTDVTCFPESRYLSERNGVRPIAHLTAVYSSLKSMALARRWFRKAGILLRNGYRYRHHRIATRGDKCSLLGLLPGTSALQAAALINPLLGSWMAI